VSHCRRGPSGPPGPPARGQRASSWPPPAAGRAPPSPMSRPPAGATWAACWAGCALGGPAAEADAAACRRATGRCAGPRCRACPADPVAWPPACCGHGPGPRPGAAGAAGGPRQPERPTTPRPPAWTAAPAAARPARSMWRWPACSTNPRCGALAWPVRAWCCPRRPPSSRPCTTPPPTRWSGSTWTCCRRPAGAAGAVQAGLRPGGDQVRRERAPTLGLDPRCRPGACSRPCAGAPTTAPRPGRWGLSGNAALVIAPRARTRGWCWTAGSSCTTTTRADPEGQLLPS
jgi:hypothetical protein